MMRHTVVFACLVLAGCAQTGTQSMSDSMMESASLCSREHKAGTPGFSKCFDNMMTAHGYCSAGSGIDAVVAVQKGTATCSGSPYATARNAPKGYSVTVANPR